ncbi:MAG TPA: Xaa-Pro peptidase family protein [Bryobacteraceae bacterium]|nr:Xaa-Pro peptidase family protein [Bryobacteraceae bacterium]
MKRRTFLVTAAAGMAAPALAQSMPDAIQNLRPMTGGIQPITADERSARIEKARRLMRENKIDAVVCEGGASMFYFTGTRWTAGERLLAWVLPLKGDSVWVVPDADRERIAPLIAAGAGVRTWKDAGDASKLVIGAAGRTARIGMEEKTRFAAFDGLRQAAPAAEFVSANPVTVGCRVIKSPAEIALLQRANDITIAAYKAAFSTLKEGMTNRELSQIIAAAYRMLGVQGGAMAIFGSYTAFPHGSVQPQQLREGDMVLIDDGCSVEGYQSDITRTTVFGKATARQREIWNLERKAQDAALAAARVGATCESVDAAARKVITDAGFGPGYKVPGLPHRTGHGIGLEGHEWTNLVKGNQTRLQPGMCFSDEPTIAIYGEFGVRLEDCMYIAESGARMFTRQSPAIDQPFG